MVVLSSAGSVLLGFKHQGETDIRCGTIVGCAVHVQGSSRHLGNLNALRRVLLRISRSISASTAFRFSGLASLSSADLLSKAAFRRSFLRICKDSAAEIIFFMTR